MQMKNCSIEKYCSLHKFSHGAEAEELREKIEQFVILLGRNYSEENFVGYVIDKLEDILDNVDARDSSGYLERKQKKK